MTCARCNDTGLVACNGPTPQERPCPACELVLPGWLLGNKAAFATRPFPPLPEAANFRAGADRAEFLPWHGPAYSHDQMHAYAMAERESVDQAYRDGYATGKMHAEGRVANRYVPRTLDGRDTVCGACGYPWGEHGASEDGRGSVCPGKDPYAAKPARPLPPLPEPANFRADAAGSRTRDWHGPAYSADQMAAYVLTDREAS